MVGKQVTFQASGFHFTQQEDRCGHLVLRAQVPLTAHWLLWERLMAISWVGSKDDRQHCPMIFGLLRLQEGLAFVNTVHKVGGKFPGLPVGCC